MEFYHIKVVCFLNVVKPGHVEYFENICPSALLWGYSEHSSASMDTI